jgi:hypothetical protein
MDSDGAKWDAMKREELPLRQPVRLIIRADDSGPTWAVTDDIRLAGLMISVLTDDPDGVDIVHIDGSIDKCRRQWLQTAFLPDFFESNKKTI